MTPECDGRAIANSQTIGSLISNEKMLKMQQLILTHTPDIILATETHLDGRIDSKTIFS